MNILFIGPLPKPITGHSIACKELLSHLEIDNQVTVIDLSKKGLDSGTGSWSRIKEVFAVLKKIFKNRKHQDVIYLTISESVVGNIKDLFIYAICYKSISKIVIHLHGGSFKNLLLDRYKLLKSINSFFLKKVGAAIVLGPSHLPIFSDIIPSTKTHVVANFAPDEIFITRTDIRDKFKQTTPLNVIFISNLMVEKGYQELLDAYICLPEHEQKEIKVTFAGDFENEESKAIFLKKMENFPEVKYVGVVNGSEKQKLFSEAHIFCLPTNYLEGQPISILEAYASGCVVVTTNRGGIGDIFEDTVNGYEILPKSAISIKTVLSRLINSKEELLKIGLHNNTEAINSYRISVYNDAITSIIKNVDTSGKSR